MGIKNLMKLVKKLAPESMKNYPLSRFKGMVIPIDISFEMYRLVCAHRRRTGKDLTNSKGQVTTHLRGMFLNMVTFIKYGITPIIVFDGKCPDMKKRTKERRSNSKVKAQSEMENLDKDSEEYKKQFQQTFTPSDDDIQNLKIMLDLMGIPYIQAEGEADVVCAWLTSKNNKSKRRYAKGTWSNDSDILTFGTPYLLTQASAEGVTLVGLEKLLECLELTMEEFQDMCVLMGCDYCEIKGIGPAKAYKLIQDHGTLKKALKVLASDKKKSYEFDYECLIEARDYFRNAVSDLDKEIQFDEDQLKVKKFQKENLYDYMCNIHGFDRVKMEEDLTMMELYYDRMGIKIKNKSNVHKPKGEVKFLIDE